MRQLTQYSCLATVAAMITGESVFSVFAELGHDGQEKPFNFLDVAAWLNRRGYHLGAYSEHAGFFNVKASWPRVVPSLLIVKLASGGRHAVYWTGSVVIDPDAGSYKALADYTVLEWWPIIKFEGVYDAQEKLCNNAGA